MTVKQKRMGKAVAALKLDFAETIEIELSDKALKLLMSEVFWNDFCFHFRDV